MLWRVPFDGRGRPVGGRSGVLCLSQHHEVVSIDPSSGSVHWRRTTGTSGTETAGSRIDLVGPLAVIGDYDVVALDTSTGAFRWRFVPQSGFGVGFYLG